MEIQTQESLLYQQVVNHNPIQWQGNNSHEKKAQKNPKKSMISEAINNRKPKRKPARTTKVW